MWAFYALPLTLIGWSAVVAGHTWIDQLTVIAPNGTFVGAPGYSRGYVQRSPQFTDASMTNLIPPDGRSTGNEILPTDGICMPSQQTPNQTEGSPRLQAAAGSFVALRYQENGHVTMPYNQPGKPANRGTVFVYGTTQPSPNDTLLAIHKVWNANQTGGDRRGILVSTQNFDDGQCYQSNPSAISQARQNQFNPSGLPFDNLQGPNLWCQQDLALPSNLTTGQPYTLYWVWDWPTAPGAPGLPNGKQELYTTCMDIDVVDPSNAVVASDTQAGFVAGQPIANAAVSSEFAVLGEPITDVPPPGGASQPGSTLATVTTTPGPTQQPPATVTEYETVTETVSPTLAPSPSGNLTGK